MHNLDSKTTQLYDLKLTEYQVPLLHPGLQVDTQPITDNKYYSDVFLPEEVFLQQLAQTK
jgi:hypothetical protein